MPCDADAETAIDDIDSMIDAHEEPNDCVATYVGNCACEACKQPPICISDNEDGEDDASDSSAKAAKAPADNPIRGGQKVKGKKDKKDNANNANGGAKAQAKGKAKGKGGKGKGKKDTAPSQTAADNTLKRKRITTKTPDAPSQTAASASDATAAALHERLKGKLQRRVPKLDLKDCADTTQSPPAGPPGDPSDGADDLNAALRPPFHIENRKPSAIRWGESYLMQAPGPTKRYFVSITRGSIDNGTDHAFNNPWYYYNFIKGLLRSTGRAMHSRLPVSSQYGYGFTWTRGAETVPATLDHR